VNLIRTVCLAGSAFYALLFIIQAAEHRPVIGESVAGVAVIAFLTIISFRAGEEELHRGEMILIWVCIILFAVYALLRAGGIR